MVMLINRAGDRGISFLTLYLTKQPGFSLQEADWVLNCLGAGPVPGPWISGWLSEGRQTYRAGANRMKQAYLPFRNQSLGVL